MASLIAKTPLGGLLPVEIGGISAVEVDPGAVTFLQPLSGQAAAVSKALKAGLGIGLPEPGEALSGEGARMLWCGPGQALCLGVRPEVEGAALIDQSDGWAVARVSGAGVRDVLARLTPLDLRPSVFCEGQTARTLLGHMTAQITPVGENAFEIMVFRSMAGTLVHDLTRAMAFAEGRARIR